MEYRYTRETIHQFVCESCRLWWSFASDSDWQPIKQYCPHCAHEHNYTPRPYQLDLDVT
jgi:hypothetical protein